MFDGPIVVGVDGSEHSRAATKAGAELSARLGADLHLIHVAAVSLSPFTVNPGEPAALAEDFRRTLDEAVTLAEELGCAVAGAHLREGKPGDEVIALCRELGAGMAVVGTRGRTRGREAVLGSVSRDVAASAACPVLVVAAENSLP